LLHVKTKMVRDLVLLSPSITELMGKKVGFNYFFLEFKYILININKMFKIEICLCLCYNF
jgi:hypothetical protein